MRQVCFAFVALMGLVVAAGCSAPADGTSTEEAASSSAALSQGTITVKVTSAPQVTVTGTGFTPGGQVQLWAYDEAEGKWASPTTVTATSCARYCLKGASQGDISTSFDLRCNSTQRILALDKTTGVYSTEPTVNVECIG